MTEKSHGIIIISLWSNIVLSTEDMHIWMNEQISIQYDQMDVNGRGYKDIQPLRQIELKDLKCVRRKGHSYVNMETLGWRT